MGVGAGVGVGVAEEHMWWGPVIRPAARAVFCMGRIRDEEEDGLGERIFIQPPEMVERQLGVAFLMCSGSSCVGSAQPTFYYPKSACSSLPYSIVLACTRSIGFQLLEAIQHCIFKPVPLSRFIYCGYGVPLLCTL